MNERWRLANRSALSWREWDGEIVVYNGASGDIHRLDALSAEAFEVLLEHTVSLDEFARQVANSLGVEENADLHSAVATIVQQFHEHGLIEPEQGG